MWVYFCVNVRRGMCVRLWVDSLREHRLHMRRVYFIYRCLFDNPCNLQSLKYFASVQKWPHGKLLICYEHISFIFWTYFLPMPHDTTTNSSTATTTDRAWESCGVKLLHWHWWIALIFEKPKKNGCCDKQLLLLSVTTCVLAVNQLNYCVAFSSFLKSNNIPIC